MAKPLIPENLISLHHGEELLRGKSIEAIQANAKLRLHMEIVECAMDVLDSFRSYPTDDEDLKVIQVLGMRQFNAFASADLGPGRYSLITGVRSGYGPVWTSLQTRSA